MYFSQLAMKISVYKYVKDLMSLQTVSIYKKYATAGGQKLQVTFCNHKLLNCALLNLSRLRAYKR